LPTLGSIGNSRRRFFSGPGIDNYDLTLQKSLRLTEARSFEFRVEAFNVLTHAQFYGPGSVAGNITLVKLSAPRLRDCCSSRLTWSFDVGGWRV
jgi:hypothetical protein